MNTPQTEMPRYKCHKDVHALRIEIVKINEDGSGTIVPRDQRYAAFTTATDWGDRFKGDENDTGYYVVYKDGYASWSPTKDFEEGYTLI